MSAEWEPHDACWMGWPKDDTWGAEIAAVERDYAAVAEAIRCFEAVRMPADPAVADRARSRLDRDIEVIEVPMEDAWLRDSGPAFVWQADQSLAGIHWRFNGWGGANPKFDCDARLGRVVLESQGVPVIPSALAMEGGEIAVDGDGTLPATDTVTFNDNGTPGLTRELAEAEFARTLGISKTIWLPGTPMNSEPTVISTASPASCAPAF